MTQEKLHEIMDFNEVDFAGDTIQFVIELMVEEKEETELNKPEDYTSISRIKTAISELNTLLYAIKNME